MLASLVAIKMHPCMFFNKNLITQIIVLSIYYQFTMGTSATAARGPNLGARVAIVIDAEHEAWKFGTGKRFNIEAGDSFAEIERQYREMVGVPDHAPPLGFSVAKLRRQAMCFGLISTEMRYDDRQLITIRTLSEPILSYLERGHCRAEPYEIHIVVSGLVFSARQQLY